MRQFILLSLLFTTLSTLAQNFSGTEEDLNQILSKIQDFSKAVMASDHKSIGMAYSEDAKIFPNNKDIISGRKAITAYWDFPEGSTISYHKISPEEIKVLGNEAYDYGYYEGTTTRKDGPESKWKGKYVIVWKKVDKEWKIYLDIWNRIED